LATNAESIDFWNEHQVAEVPEDISAEESLDLIEWRNGLYPGLLDLMPVDYPGYQILDFGCGPGHDTIQFLLNGAKRVYAADVSAKGLTSLRARLRAHGLEERCTVMNLGLIWSLPKSFFDHIHAAGVMHHLEHPVPALRKLARALRPHSEIRMMVYSTESQFFQQHCKADPAIFASRVDHGAPIVHAYSRAEVVAMAANANLLATYMGSYRIPEETKGLGLSSCWSLKK
jgi:SAM-dependent methyltransferase